MTLVTEQRSQSYDHYYSAKLYDSDGFVYYDIPRTVDSTVTVYEQVTKDIEKRRWRDLIRNGQCATTELSGYRQTFETSPNIFRGRTSFDNGSPTRFTEQTDAFFYEGIPDATDPSVLEESSSRSASNLYSNLQAVDTKFKGLVFFGELRETLSMIRHPFRNLRRGISDYLTTINRNGRRYKLGKKRQGYIAGTWLEYSYGWAPLIADIDSGIKAFYGSSLVRPIQEMVRGRGKTEDVLSTSRKTLGWGLGYYDYSVQTLRRCETKHYTVYRYQGNGEPETLHRYGFNPREFVPTLWELIPYSFLVDYFTNVGDFISALTFLDSSVKWCNVTKRLKATRYIHNSFVIPANQFPPAGAYRLDGSQTTNPESESTVVQYSRTPVTSFVPSLHFDFGSLTKWRRMTNMFALLASSRSI